MISHLIDLLPQHAEQGDQQELLTLLADTELASPEIFLKHLVEIREAICELTSSDWTTCIWSELN